MRNRLSLKIYEVKMIISHIYEIQLNYAIKLQIYRPSRFVRSLDVKPSLMKAASSLICAAVRNYMWTFKHKPESELNSGAGGVNVSGGGDLGLLCLSSLGTS